MKTQVHVRIAIAINFQIEVDGLLFVVMQCPNYPTFLEKKLFWE